uniref:Paxillin n=1 Tax=Cyprinus carpio TaxID=7962 RepID=A0A8C2GPK9_CYPCA
MMLCTSSKPYSEKLLVVSSAKSPAPESCLSPEPSAKTSNLPALSLHKREVISTKTVDPKISSPFSVTKNSPPVVPKASSPVITPRISKSPSPPQVIKSSNRVVDVKSPSPITTVKTSTPVVVRKSPSLVTAVRATKSPIPGTLAKSPSPEPGITSKSPVPTTISLPAPPVSTLTLTPKASKEKPESFELGILGISLPCPKPLLEEALDKLLMSSLSQPEPVKLGEGTPASLEVNDDILACFHQSTPSGGLKDVTWMDDPLNSTSFPEESDVSLDLPLLQPSAVERLSASGQIMAQGKSSPASVPKQGNKLDNMLGSLQSDLNRLGVQTVAKGVCGACKKPIAGQVVTAMGRTWHPEHFVCTHCQEEIGSKNFFERDGQPYCEKDYHSLFSPRCYYCNGPILDRVVTALDRTWHPEHFFCAQCGSFFGPEGFHEKEGKAYCRKDYFDMFAPKCGGCARAILENYISALNALWHPECFVCRECFTPFVNGSFFEHEGQPYCEAHYHEHRGSLCSGCQKPITGRCITAMGKKFHPEHFVCAFCLKQLNKGTFKEQNDKPYCQNCFVKLFS